MFEQKARELYIRESNGFPHQTYWQYLYIKYIYVCTIILLKPISDLVCTEDQK